MRPGPILKAAFGLLALAAFSAHAAPPTSIIRDGSLGRAGAVLPTNPGFYEITPAMGKTVGANLFQSFGTFNLGTNDTADFTANAGTQNIIARVTGGSASNIDGTVESAANLYFINPAGILFTANAKLDVNGAFVVSTASYAKLSDGTIFYADVNHPINDAGLTSAPVSAFGFLNATPQTVAFFGAYLENPGGIHVIAGEILLDDAFLFAPGGNLTMFSAASGGEVPFSLASPGAGFASATTPNLGPITMENYSLASITSAQGGGKIVIRGGQIVVENDSRIGAGNLGAAAGGGISIQAVSLVFQTGGNLFSNATSTGPGGNIAVQSGSISVEGADSVGNSSGIFAQSTGAGDAGSVTLNATGAIALSEGGEILTTAENGAGGDIVLGSGSLSIDGASPAGNLSVISTFGGATGRAGSLSVTTGALSLTNGGQIGTHTSNEAGAIVITADSLVADGAAGNADSGIYAFGSGAGTSAAIQIMVTGPLSLTDGGSVGAFGGGGGAGTIAITAGSLDVVGNSLLGQDAGIYAATTSAANAGTIDLTVAGAASFSAGGNINTTSLGAGNAGNVVLRAGSLSIDGYDSAGNDSGIYSGADGTTAAGDGGTIQVVLTGALSLTSGGVISAGSQGAGNAGDITVDCGSLAIAGFDFNGNTSAIASGAFASGNGGDLTVDVAGPARLTNGGEITADASGSGRAGAINLTARQLQVEGSTGAPDDLDSVVSSNNGGSGLGGVVNIAVAGAMRIAGGGQISANTLGSGDAGSVTVRAGELSVAGADSLGEGSSISSRATAAGNSGIVNVIVGGAVQLSAGGQITAASKEEGDAGSVTVFAGTLAIAGLETVGKKTFISSISSAALGEGNGGTVDITAPGGVTLSDYAQVTAYSHSANAGDVRMQAGSLTLTGGAQIATGAAIDGGDITLKIGRVVYLLQSSISASAAEVGGNITIDPEFVVLDDSTIGAFGGVANGNIVIDTSYFLDEDSPVFATGAITISVPDLNLSDSLLALPSVLVDNEKRLRESCARSVKHEFSTLTVVGRGGTELAPDELQPDFGVER